MKYVVIFEHGPTSWSAYVPDLPGCTSTGETRGQCDSLIQKAIKLRLEGLRAKGQPVPMPSTEVGIVEIPADYEPVAWDAGFAAGQAGQSAISCPYPSASTEAFSWYSGFIEGKAPQRRLR